MGPLTLVRYLVSPHPHPTTFKLTLPSDVIFRMTFIVEGRWILEENLVSFFHKRKHPDAEQIKQWILSAVQVYHVPFDRVIGMQNDSVSVNRAAVNPLCGLFSNMAPLTCSSHMLNRVGERLTLPRAELFLQRWLAVFSRSDDVPSESLSLSLSLSFSLSFSLSLSLSLLSTLRCVLFSCRRLVYRPQRLLRRLGGMDTTRSWFSSSPMDTSRLFHASSSSISMGGRLRSRSSP